MKKDHKFIWILEMALALLYVCHRGVGKHVIIYIHTIIDVFYMSANSSHKYTCTEIQL